MAKPRVFLSSTFYDLKQIRADIDIFVESLGYEAVRNEEGDIPYGKDDSLEEYCYKEIKNVDVLVSIVGGRFGTESKRNHLSISQIELKTALKEGKQVYIFIEKNVLAEYETYLLNKGGEIKYRYVDDVRVYSFIEEIKGINANNNIKGFETSNDITQYLKEQFAGLFQRFLEEQTRVKEVSLITNLEKTAQTLNKLVNYLTDENKDQADEINKILSINHPLVEALGSILNIPYNFFVEGLSDLKELLNARGLKYDDFSVEIADDGFYYWEKETARKDIVLKISCSIFDEEGKLKFIKKSDWKEENISYIEEDKIEDDGLPF